MIFVVLFYLFRDKQRFLEGSTIVCFKNTFPFLNGTIFGRNSCVFICRTRCDPSGGNDDNDRQLASKPRFYQGRAQFVAITMRKKCDFDIFR